MLVEAESVEARASPGHLQAESDSNDIVSSEQQGSKRKRQILVDVGSSPRSPTSCGKRSFRLQCDSPVDTCTELMTGPRLTRQLEIGFLEGDTSKVSSSWELNCGATQKLQAVKCKVAKYTSMSVSIAGNASSVGLEFEGMHEGAGPEVLQSIHWADRDKVESEHSINVVETQSVVQDGLTAPSACQDSQSIFVPDKVTMPAHFPVQTVSPDRETEEPSCNTKGRTGYTIADEEQVLNLSPGDIVVAINAGGCSLSSQSYGIEFSEDQYCSGGDVLETEEVISQTREPFLYETARHGNVSYVIPNLLRGDYVVNLHFAEIMFTGGPPGMRVFDISIQGDKIVSHLDVYALVGPNKALILSVPTTVSNGVLALSFEGVSGCPTISAICIQKAPSVSSAFNYTTEDENIEDLVHGMHHLERSQQQNEEDARRKLVRVKAKQCFRDYEEELERLKKDCHEAWVCLDHSQMENKKLRSELTAKTSYIDSLAIVVEAQQDELKDVKEHTERQVRGWKDALQGAFREARILQEMHPALSREVKDWMVTFPDVSSMVLSVQKLAKEHELLKAKYLEESQARRHLFNKIIELKGNIRVFCRCRPLNIAERAVGLSSVIEIEKGSVKDDELIVQTGTSCKKVFKFDRIFSPKDNQEDVFADTAPVVVSVLDGYNVCIFAYGQTGTGKTFTMVGSPEDRGVNYRTLEELFRVASERKGQFLYDITVSVLEVYNEQIRDLLTPPSLQGGRKLEIKQVSEGVNHVPGLIEAQVHSMSEVWEVLQSGSNARAVGSTNCNEHSSRSHFVLCVMVKAENLLTTECTRSKLWLVDLAGSERVTKSDAQRDRLKEAQYINKSLASLGDVIYALTTKGSHIPYRNSKLTHLLQHSLGGDSKTLMFVQVSPNETDVAETLSSLNFASRVRGIELGPVKKQLDLGEMLKYKQQAEKSKQDILKLEERLRSAESQLQMKEQLSQSLNDKVKDRGRSITELQLQVTSEKKLRCQTLRISQESATDRGLFAEAREGPPERTAEAHCTTRRPLLERAVAYDLRQSDGSENALKCSTDSSGFRNENTDPEMRGTDKLKVLPLRFTSPSPQKLLPRCGRASSAGVPKISSMLGSPLIKSSGRTQSRTTLAVSDKLGQTTPSVLRPPGLASPGMMRPRPILRRSTMHVGSSIPDTQQRRDLESRGQLRRIATETSPAPAVADRKQVSLPKPLTSAQRVTRLKQPAAAHRWNN